MRRIRYLVGVVLATTCARAAPLALDPDTLIAEGTRMCLHYSYDQAEKFFAAARSAADPGSQTWLEATLGLAVALHHRVPLSAQRIHEQAAPLYEEVFAKGGPSLLAAQAALNRGRIAQQRDEKADTVDNATAQLWYQKVIDGWPHDPIAGEATIRMAVSLIESFEPDQVRKGIALAEERAAAFPDQMWAGSLWQLAGDSWWTVLGNRAEAIRCLLQAEKFGFADPSRAWVPVWRIASLAKDEGKSDIAIEHFRAIITKYPSSGKGWEAQQHLIDMGIKPPLIKPPLDLEDKGDAP
jgi:hypothetical protein